MKFKNLHIVAASILFAIVMWISINMTYDYSTSVSIPVILENFPETEALQSPVPKQLTARLRGNGWNLSSLKLTRDLKLIIDVTELDKNNVLNTDKLIFDKLRLSAEVNVLDVEPDSLVIILDEKIFKKVPIIPEVVTFFKDGYSQIGDTFLDPDSINISGSKTYLDNILYWKSKRYEFKDISESIKVDLELFDPPDYLVNLKKKNIKYQIQVEPFAEKLFTGINVEVISTPFNRDIIIIPPKMDLIVRGSIAQLSEFSNDNINIFIEYFELMSDSTGYFTPQIKTPEGIKVVQRQPEQFQYIIRKRLQ